ncbi:unnamed protein product [Effrenium voratum]|uniref:Methyltransferase type 12 domain-containing protein n=1 Tax=Effrenium voratum TaxID=2562239 RepID=A0AA36NEG3_9DINO|nr:unnamed protein product [Effrenium voratum]
MRAVDIVGVAEAAGSGGLGRSLRAAKDFAAGEEAEVLRVPLRLAFLEVEDAPTQPRLAEGRLLDARRDGPRENEDELAVRLAAGRGEASVLRLDLRVGVFCRATRHRLLPSQMPNHPLFYSDESSETRVRLAWDWSFAERLVAGHLLRSAWHEVAQGWQRREKAAALGVTEQDVDFRWAHAALRSRGHAVRLRDDGLVPVADLLNWAPKSRCNVRCGTRYLDTSKAGLDGFFACTALGSVDRGAELFTEYISSSERRNSNRTRAGGTGAVFLREYGFVPEDSEALGFLAPNCGGRGLACAAAAAEVAELERHFGDVEGFLAAGLQNSSQLEELAEREAVAPALRQLARLEGRALRRVAKELARRDEPRRLYRRWRGDLADPGPAAFRTAEARRLWLLLRDAAAFETAAWDAAVQEAGRLLLEPETWDDLLAIEVLSSHHDFSAALELRCRALRRAELEAPPANPGLRCALAAQALLNDFAWPASESEALLAAESADASVRAMYVPTHASELEDLCPRAAALQAERDWEVGESIQSCAGSSAHAESVEELYSKHPYPSWRRFASSQTSRPKTRVRSLLAGVGTGKAILAHLEHFEPEEILAVDLSESSLRVAKRQLLALGFDLSKVSLRKCDLFSLEDSERFDVIESVGVVHHLPDPRAGLRKLRQLLAVEGTLVLGLYSRTARRSVNVVRALAQEAVAARGAVSVAEVEAARMGGYWRMV